MAPAGFFVPVAEQKAKHFKPKDSPRFEWDVIRVARKKHGEIKGLEDF
ncbi:hypothetical protein [Sphingomonas abaci]|uniref:Uncharacterized protein n=1 Tax=Sphingomonas abaci TaxID=237611 RepID=A0A7W7EX58_9SPHN|nr:hypothetical protein [Sphingomonas abaci]MBB4616771.1 hypothetical protein [Sphingomonas abaci]